MTIHVKLMLKCGETVAEWETTGAFPQLGDEVENGTHIGRVRWLTPSSVELYLE